MSIITTSCIMAVKCITSPPVLKSRKGEIVKVGYQYKGVLVLCNRIILFIKSAVTGCLDWWRKRTSLRHKHSLINNKWNRTSQHAIPRSSQNKFQQIRWCQSLTRLIHVIFKHWSRLCSRLYLDTFEPEQFSSVNSCMRTKTRKEQKLFESSWLNKQYVKEPMLSPSR